MCQDCSSFLKDTYMPDMRGMSTWENNGIQANTELTKTHELRVDPPRRMSDYNDERRYDQEYIQSVRPSTLQKLVKKFDGSNHPYDHITSLSQVVRAEQVSDK